MQRAGCLFLNTVSKQFELKCRPVKLLQEENEPSDGQAQSRAVCGDLARQSRAAAAEGRGGAGSPRAAGRAVGLECELPGEGRKTQVRLTCWGQSTASPAVTRGWHLIPRE